MGARDLLRSMRPGDDRALAAELRQKEQAAERRREAGQTEAARAISDRDKRRTPAEVAASKERGRRSKRGAFEPPAPGVNP
ncbi:hypothetical protein OOK58_42165 [Streptomyces sp. NBC_01728]|uniref:hypothetical protein n=1 Tax=unclassified Streptomyces TaxID=2593676 RepID=UPI002251D9DC|nr:MULTISPECIES: hypothetical protein [unclassified Streptomyces]MCX4458521.1 hypothetical protein [Streptomyces sp. NBC_01719]MCX4497878.1 hypothetical protein [Streptomyces sp. NBC_01728]